MNSRGGNQRDNGLVIVVMLDTKSIGLGKRDRLDGRAVAKNGRRDLISPRIVRSGLSGRTPHGGSNKTADQRLLPHETSHHASCSDRAVAVTRGGADSDRACANHDDRVAGQHRAGISNDLGHVDERKR